MQQPRNFLIEDVEINYPKLDPNRPVENPFAKGQFYWEMQVVIDDAEKAKMLKDNHFNVKEKDGKFILSLKRKTQKSSGEANGPVRVVDADTKPIERVQSIGNGSRANIIVFQYPWSNFGNSGVGSSLTAVQVTEMKLYEASDSVEFKPVAGVAPVSAEDAEATMDSPF